MVSHRFYVPVGVVPLAAPPASPGVGDTYFDTTIEELRSWNGLEWVGGEVAIQAGEPSDAQLELWVDVASDPVGASASDVAAILDRLERLEARLRKLEGR